jgi:hypothetical protein
MTSAPLLAPLPSSCRGRRQRIPGVTPGLGFFAHPPTPALAAGTCSALDRRGERRGGYFVPVVRFALAVGSHYPPGLVRVNAGQGWSCRPRIRPLLGQACQPFGLFSVTAVQACVRAPGVAAGAALSGHLPVASPLPSHPVGLGVRHGFLPAPRIEDQSLPWGRCISLFTAAVGNRAPHRTTSCPGPVRLLSWLLIPRRCSRRFRGNESQPALTIDRDAVVLATYAIRRLGVALLAPACSETGADGVCSQYSWLIGSSERRERRPCSGDIQHP